MSINEADQAIPAADQAIPAAGVHSGVAGVRSEVAGGRSEVAGGRSGVAAPLLRPLGDAGAAVCADGFCEVPQGQLAAPEQAATTGAAE